jgi:hypothetical protein
MFIEKLFVVDRGRGPQCIQLKLPIVENRFETIDDFNHLANVPEITLPKVSGWRRASTFGIPTLESGSTSIPALLQPPPYTRAMSIRESETSNHLNSLSLLS